MEAQYTWLSIGNSSGESRGGHVARGTGAIVEIMGALINNPSVFADEIQDKIWSGVTLCIGGEMKSSGEGKPASNFRYEKDLTLNSTVVANFVYLFDWHKKMNDSKPIFITTIPRQMRDYSWFIKEDGTMIRKDQKWRRRAENPSDPVSHHGFPGGEDALDKEDDVFMIFLSANCVEKEQMVKIRECCKGARYHTYLVDMLSFLYQLRCNDKDFTSTFKPEYRVLQVDNDGTKDQLYFNHSMDSSGHVFMCPKWESVMVIYRDLYEAISLEENDTKAKIREHLKENEIQRWTDFSANDTDDAFTILMMIHAFNGITGERNEFGCAEGVYYKPTEEDKIILDKLHESLEDWRSQLE
tara:strand:+ start:2204 stop:3268 length:1065 start_codon:yes stop_codon:yes gene_type:complete